MIYKNLSDSSLLNETYRLVTEERRITIEVLHALREIEARALFAKESYSSLFDFCVKRLGYSESQSVRRISAMRLLKAIPEVETQVASGQLKVSQLAQIQTFIRAERKEMGRVVSREETRKLLSDVAGRSSRETERVILAQSPALQQKRQTEERVRPVTESHTEIRFVADSELMNLIQEAKNLTAHNREMNPSVADLMKRGLQLLVEKKKKERGVTTLGDSPRGIAPPRPVSEISSTTIEASNLRNGGTIPGPTVHATSAVARPRSRYIPAAIKKAVLARAQNRCEFVAPGSENRRCESSHALELHHHHPFSRGGDTSVENLRAYCRPHNAAQGAWDFPCGATNSTQPVKHQLRDRSNKFPFAAKPVKQNVSKGEFSMLMKTGFFALALVASVAAQADVPRPTPVAGERLIGYTVHSTGITFQVHSGGCSTKESFALTTGLSRGPADGVVNNVTLVRTAADYCEAYLPYGTTVTFTWPELCPRGGCEHIVVKNAHSAIRPDIAR